MARELPTGWARRRLGDVINLKRGYDLPQQNRRPGTVPIISSSGQSGVHDEAKAPAPGVVTGRYGTIGEVFLIEEDYWPLNTALYVQDFRGNEPAFVAALLKTINWRAHNGKSGVPGINRNHVHEDLVDVPRVAEQQAIAAVLGALDDKIESNRRTGSAAERAASQVSQQVARIVTGTAIPDAWRIASFAQSVVINPQVRIARGAETPFVEMAAVEPFATRPARLARRGFSGGCKFESGDVLFARITGCIEHGKGAFVDFVEEPSAGSTEFVVFRGRPPLTPAVVFALSRDERLRAHAIANMIGTSGRQRVDNSCWNAIDVAIAPMSDERRNAAAAAAGLMSLSRSLWSETRTLTAIRDALLPKLVSGQIRVPPTRDEQEAVGTVVAEFGDEFPSRE